MKLAYRPYQHKYINGIKLDKSNLVISFMRSGKSAIMKGIVDKHFDGKKVLILVGIRSIVVQLSEYFDNHTFILAGKKHNTEELIHLASFQTLQRRSIDLTDYDCIIIDEAHMRYNTPIVKEIRSLNCTRIFFTGTPLKPNGRFLDDNIDNILEFTSAKQMIEEGYLAKTRFISRFSVLENESDIGTRNGEYIDADIERVLDKQAVVEQLVEDNNTYHWSTEHKAILYVNSIKVAEKVIKLFNDDVNVRMIHSKLTKNELEDVQDWFKSAKAGIIVNVRMLTVGVNIPDADTILYLTPTRITSLYLQCIWRASTKFEDKLATVYDYSGVLSRISPYYDDWRKLKKTCKEQCESIKDPREQFFCKESCVSDPILVGCTGELPSSHQDNKYVSNFRVIEGESCGFEFPVFEWKFKQEATRVGYVTKQSECPSCGCITAYDIQTVTDPSDMVIMYDDEITVDTPTNAIVCIYDRVQKRALALFDDPSKIAYRVFEFTSSEQLYKSALSYFNNQPFSVTSNIKMSKIPNVKVTAGLNNLVPLIDWSLKDQSGIVKKILKTKLESIAVDHFNMKSGYVYYFAREINRSNEKEVMKFLNKPSIDRVELLKFKTKLEKQNNKD